MPATARKLALSDTTLDINEATAQELREALPGIGDILARRIVEYRNEHGPFASAEDLMRVPGLNGKRLSKFAPRISLSPPNSGYRFQAAPTASSPPASEDFIQPMPIFSIASEPLPQQFAPSIDSLLPKGPAESMGPAFVPTGEPEPMSPSFRPMAPANSYEVGGSLLAGPRESLSAGLSRRPQPEPEPVTEEDTFGIPLHRPMRVGVALVAIGLFSALVGSVFGIRSQEGGPRARLEQRIGATESNVADIAGTVKALEGQASTFASSINALDARIAQQSREAQKTSGPAAEKPAPQPAPIVEATRDSDSRTSVRRRVRQAMRELDAVAPSNRTP